MSAHKQRVTIALPVFNEGPFIRQTVLSAVSQADHILVCDNASTDGTSDIARNLARQFSNVEYIRHSENIGAINNYHFALKRADTEYFMWLGGHDAIAQNYIETLINAIDSDSDVVLAFSPATHIDREGKYHYTYQCQFAEFLNSDSAAKRVNEIVRNLTDCSLVHGLFRLSTLRKAWFDVPCIGFDNVMICRAAALGKFLYVPGTEYVRRNPRMEDTLEEQLERILPGISSRDPNHYQDMLRGQFEVVCSLDGGVFTRTFRKERARFRLVKSFGYFNDGTHWGSFKNQVITFFLNFLRHIKHRLQS